ncbi:ABC transporter ATP-binding protein [Haloarchaeobius litoreus]|uniref:Probable branched-chain amino acid transport ATP-binding protein LivG n=1 Tax=Haloarchaeobius litoreus TaxID=755306 RepID=A0ABD6DH52_9EURY|nr:ABC transporter ATP-binding protein [Haloarchaeobius litoreus]
MATTDDAPTFGSGEVVLETKGLTRRFGELVAVDSLDIEVERGEFRSIIGPNGAGKTTLFNLISGALLPSDGSVIFDGEDVSRLRPHERVHKGIGRSFQITNVFGGLTVRENVRLAAQAVLQGRSPVDNAFRHKDSFDDLNGRTDDVLSRIELGDRDGERASTLAYGDRRRLEIGLVLATDPQLVMLDEPTAGMSAEETRNTMELIGDVLGDRTVLLIEHDIELVMNASDRITVLNRGEELATGPPEAVAENEQVQQAYLGGGVL